MLKNIGTAFHVIVANLPYVNVKAYQTRIKNLKWEPKKSLTDGTNDWLLYKRLCQQAPAHLNPAGMILMEIDPQSRNRLVQYQKTYLPGAELKFQKDLAGKYRFAILVSK